MVQSNPLWLCPRRRAGTFRQQYPPLLRHPVLVHLASQRRQHPGRPAHARHQGLTALLQVLPSQIRTTKTLNSKPQPDQNSNAISSFARTWPVRQPAGLRLPSFFAPRMKKRPEQLRRLVRQQTAFHVHPVIKKLLLEKASLADRHSGPRLTGRINNPGNARMYQQPGTHAAGFQCDVQRTARQTIILYAASRLPYRLHFSMGTGVMQSNRLIETTPKYHTITHQHCTHRNFALARTLLCQLQRLTHELQVTTAINSQHRTRNSLPCLLHFSRPPRARLMSGLCQSPVMLYRAAAIRENLSPTNRSITNSAPPIAGAPAATAASGKLRLIGIATCRSASIVPAGTSSTPWTLKLLETPSKTSSSRVRNTPPFMSIAPSIRS